MFASRLGFLNSEIYPKCKFHTVLLLHPRYTCFLRSTSPPRFHHFLSLINQRFDRYSDNRLTTLNWTWSICFHW
ncbi:hypothetical protein L1887_25549 [Cichorium endivia]|nr:hypothetical protein L1887_25549 [Cichorium endivia]